ncbi:MAG: ferritin-like domain-containing protein [Syntrophothermus sp.]
MENSNQKVIDTLNHLIAIAYDGKNGYMNAAESVKEEGMRNTFEHFSQERENFIIQLQQQVIRLGGEAQDNGGPLGAIHRTWMDMKSIFTSGDKDSIVSACITGEETAIKEYRESLEEPYITGNVKQLIAEQLRGIESALSRIRAHANAPQDDWNTRSKR